MAFWLTAGAMVFVVALLLGRAMLRDTAGRADNSDLDVYRDQLAEVDRDRARGVIGDAEAERLRLEVSRRLLDADRKAAAATTARMGPRRGTWLAALAATLSVVAISFALYATLGAPGYPDLPISRRVAMAEEAQRNRPGQEMAEAEAALSRPPLEENPRHTELMQRLRETLAERPDDIEGHVLLARNEAGLGNFVAARQAQERVLELRGDAATAADWADYALLLVYAAGGYVSPEAEAAVAETLHRDPANGTARYLSGLLNAQTGRPDIAFRVWRALLEESAPDAPWSAPIRDRIGDIARLAGVEYQAPAARGPSREDMAAAADMTAEDRQAMIRGMVDGLASRLAETGGPAEDWARLITALGVLGETDRAGAIYAEARETFGADPQDLALIEDAAEQAGVAE